MADREKEITNEIADRRKQIRKIQEDLNSDIQTHENALKQIESKLGTEKGKRREKIRELKKEKKALEDACFVATALYGDIEHPVVRDLRHFRDTCLLPSCHGRAMVSLYYRIGPHLARLVRPTSATSRFLRSLLEGFVRVAGIHKLKEGAERK